MCSPGYRLSIRTVRATGTKSCAVDNDAACPTFFASQFRASPPIQLTLRASRQLYESYPLVAPASPARYIRVLGLPRRWDGQDHRENKKISLVIPFTRARARARVQKDHLDPFHRGGELWRAIIRRRQCMRRPVQILGTLVKC